ncbi:hypothetical protein [Orientia tsutsugamushi]|uniref:Uncharacterized protein n=1 Tax=Orientia tsutsugamushi TaxID=784 RepID=A0A2U3QTW1_ORITS|nr:hypothetical protein [Orientia tsutsugamushi]KJV55140.1 hypothetical protein OTSKATO_0772 [Orientia tsutsugamushi str. Kato PP]SPR04404.1 Uncharacterised protein [Orientia tsutsugamushi]
MNNIYSAVVSMVNNVTSNFNFPHVSDCLLSPRVNQLFIKSTNKAIEYYEICKSIFIHNPKRDDLYGHMGVKVLHDTFNCESQTCIGSSSMTVPGDLTSGINGKGIVITGLFNNSNNNYLYNSLQEWSGGTCKMIPNCNVESIVENIKNMMDDSEKTGETCIAAGAGAGAGVVVGVIATSLIVYFFCRSKKNDCVVVKKCADVNSNPSNFFMEKVKDSTNGDNMIVHQHHDNIHDPIYAEFMGSSAKDTTAVTVETSDV